MTKDLFEFENRYLKLNKNDVVFTPKNIAKMLIKEFNPTGYILDPCKGTGAFYDNLPEPKDWCEITENRDFYKWNKKVDWLFSNPPYSDFDKWLEHSFSLANNIMYLTPLAKVFKSIGTIRKIKNFGGIVKIIFIPANICGFPFGFPVGAFHFKKDYKKMTEIKYAGI